ncbi:MAG: Ig-like domain-containing protein [Acidobacteriaceae bacterium]
MDASTQACGTRFDFTPGFSLTFPYSQLGSDNQALTQTYLLASNVASSQSSTTTDTYQVALSAKVNVPSELGPLSGTQILGNLLGAQTVEQSLTAGEELAWTNRWTTSKNSAVLHTQALTIANPLSSDNYSGPQEVQVWKDNLYGTFMFYPKPSDTSWILTSNQSTIGVGNLVTLSATVTPDPSIPYTPTGTVTFYDGCVELGSASVNPATGTATFPTTSIVSPGVNTIQAIYGGDTNFYHNSAIPITITVNQ